MEYFDKSKIIRDYERCKIVFGPRSAGKIYVLKQVAIKYINDEDYDNALEVLYELERLRDNARGSRGTIIIHCDGCGDYTDINCYCCQKCRDSKTDDGTNTTKTN